MKQEAIILKAFNSDIAAVLETFKTYKMPCLIHITFVFFIFLCAPK